MTRPTFRWIAAVLAILLAGCAQREPPPVAPPADAPAVVRHPAEPLPPSTQLPAAPSAAVPAQPLSGIVVPPEAVYLCVNDRGGPRTLTVIEFAPNVLALCRRHPEMGPCQYERNQCRAGGGRVFAADGKEITMATEAEYDKKVMRVRFQAK